MSTNGWPLDITRVAATTHCAVTQGTGLPETLKGQPPTTHSALITTVGWPPTSTRGLGAVGLAVLDVLEREDLQVRAARVGRELRAQIEQLAQRHALIGEDWDYRRSGSAGA